jgi:hypothetical protein
VLRPAQRAKAQVEKKSISSIFSLLSLEISELASIAVKYDRILAHLSDVIVVEVIL